LKGLPLAYNRDLQEDKEPLFDSVATLLVMMPALTGAVRTIGFDTDAMDDAAADGMLLATDLAEYLVAKGHPFREAHEVVGRVVQRAIAQDRSLAALTADELRSLSDVFGPDVHEVLSARASVERRGAPGPSSASIASQLEHLAASVAQIRSALG
jgi:argininosuccinate lyase